MKLKMVWAAIVGKYFHSSVPLKRSSKCARLTTTTLSEEDSCKAGVSFLQRKQRNQTKMTASKIRSSLSDLFCRRGRPKAYFCLRSVPKRKSITRRSSHQ